jgi:AcrR family transcriptional regulator
MTTTQIAHVLMAPAGAARPESRTERGKRQKLVRILRTARQLFERKGFDATTMKEIAAGADIGHGTLFLYARSKEDLLVMMFRDEVVRAVDEAIATVPSRRPLLDQIVHVLGAIVTHHEQHVPLARVFVKELPFVDDARHGVAAFMTNLLGHMAGLIERAQANGELSPDPPPMLLARNLFALFFSIMQRWLGHERVAPAARDRWIREALELQLGRFRTRTAPRVARRAPRARRTT